MMRHYKYECGIPQRFECPYCKHHLRQRSHVWTHIRTIHPKRDLYCIDIATDTILYYQEHRTDYHKDHLPVVPTSANFPIL
ncbi:unnamed protein product [Xylocopa violacea]|uniref:C2H2-type domain-containing protein n=1 Tax=Xylocopa violacea TaxID=135666 RepID=A0ABP1NHG2_XYLVO